MDGTDLGRVLLPAARHRPPLAATGSSEVVPRGRRELGGDGAERVGGNAVALSGRLVGHVAEGVAGLAVAVEESGSGGGGVLARKRGLSLPILPPPKRRVVSAKRQFPPGCGRIAPPLMVGGDDENSLQVEGAPSGGGFNVLEQAATAPPGSSVHSEEDRLLLELAPSNAVSDVLEKAAAAYRGLPMAVGYHHVPEAAVVKLPDTRAEDGAALVAKETANAEASGKLGPLSPIPPKRRMVSAKRSFPPGCRRGSAAPLASGGGSEVSLQLEVPPANGDLGALTEVAATDYGVSVTERCAMDTMEGGVSQDALNGAVELEELEEGEIPTGAKYIVQEPEVTLSSMPHESAVSRYECGVPEIVAEGPFNMSHFSTENICENTLRRKGKSVSWAVAEDVKVVNKCEASSPKVAAELSAESPLKGNSSDKRVSESRVMKRASLDPAAGVFAKGTMRSKMTLTARKTVRSPAKASRGSGLATLNRPYSMDKESVATTEGSLVPRKKLMVKEKHIPTNIISTSSTLSKEKLKDKESSLMEDDDIFKMLALNEIKLDLHLNVPSLVPSILGRMQHGCMKADARSKVRMVCRKFQFICRTLVQAAEQGSLKVRRIDLLADKIIRKSPGFTKPGSVVGKVPGVEIGDEFLYRVELAIVGLHRLYQGGIDSVRDINGVPIAISIVASGGYPDELSSSGEVIYTGSGGKPAGKKKDEDQQLQRGNLALKNCIKTKTPVRVIHGFKAQNRELGSHSKAKEISTFTYDGLYLVVDCWQEGLSGSRVFKYRLQRIPGQPELPLHAAKGLRKSIARPGLCFADISQGKERIPICVINTIDNVRPASFKYISRNKYPSLPPKRSAQGCDCTNGCSDSATCSCAVRNGGKLPFNFNGAVVHAKPLIFECGPSCGCPPSCHNRVSQFGMKIPLEVFRTAKTGWGVRSLRSITSGSFICEYVGELLHDKKANQRMNDEYLFAIGHNYDIWKGLPSDIPGLNSSSDSHSLNMEDEGFTIDAAEYGNIGRFINHSCSPNLYAQNVLWDHDDKRMPHIMFFAAENISPLQELTYDYNYEIDNVHDVTGRVKVKSCHCGSPQCRGRLY